MTRHSKISGLSHVKVSILDSFEKEVLVALGEMGYELETGDPISGENRLDTRLYNFRYFEQTLVLEYHMQCHNFVLRLPAVKLGSASELPLLTLVANEVNGNLIAEKAVLWHWVKNYIYMLDIETAICSDEYIDLKKTLASKRDSLVKAQEKVLEVYDKFRGWYGTQDPWSERDSFLSERQMRMQHLKSEDMARYEEEMAIPLHRFEAEAHAGKAKKPAGDGRRYSIDDVVAYSPLMKQLLPAVAPTWQVGDITYMKILCDEYTYVDDQEDIMFQPILAPMVEGRGSDTIIRMKDCTYILGDHSRHTLVMHIQYKGENKRKIIFQLDVLHDELCPNQPLHHLGKTTSQSMLVCIDKVKEDQRKAEYHYMVLDAQDKIKARQEQELTMAQRVSTLSPDDEVKELLYVGTKAFRARCYAQALIPLLRAYRKLDAIFGDMNKRRFENFMECLYMIGYCLDEMGQYERAHYYLSQIPMWSSTKYEEERLYCFEHLDDHMLISHLLELRYSYLEYYDWDPENLEGEQNNFYVILMHLLTDAYIKARKYKDAEEILQAEIKHERLLDCAEGLLLRVRSESKNAHESEKEI